jgi:hypothetical protein
MRRGFGNSSPARRLTVTWELKFGVPAGSPRAPAEPLDRFAGDGRVRTIHYAHARPRFCSDQPTRIPTRERSRQQATNRQATDRKPNAV